MNLTEAKYLTTYDDEVYTDSSKDVKSHCNAITFFPPAAGGSPYAINNAIVLTEDDSAVTYAASSPDELIVKTFSIVFLDAIKPKRAVLVKKHINVNPQYKQR